MSNSEHEWKFTGCHPHNGEYWYQCLKCGATDWIAHYGTMDQLKPEKCVPAVEEAPTTPANAPSYEDLVNALVQVRHATAPTPDDGGHHEAAHDIADAVLKRVATVQRAAPEPLACHVCGTTSEIHGQFCSVAPPPPLTKEERALLLHTLCGLEHDRPSYRNRYWVFPLSDPPRSAKVPRVPRSVGAAPKR